MTMHGTKGDTGTNHFAGVCTFLRLQSFKLCLHLPSFSCFIKTARFSLALRSVYTYRFLARLMLLRLTAHFLISIVSMVTG